MRLAMRAGRTMQLRPKAGPLQALKTTVCASAVPAHDQRRWSDLSCSHSLQAL
jgi:hypothetical protein